MAITTSDTRVVKVDVSAAELVALLGSKALEAGLIDFTPDSAEVIPQGDGSAEIVFIKAIV